MIGLFFIIRDMIKQKKFDKIFLFLILTAILTIYSYLNTPIKASRYLFNLILPLTYLSYFALINIRKKEFRNTIPILSILLIIIFTVSLMFVFYSLNYNDNKLLSPSSYSNIAVNLSNDIKDCTLLSNAHIFLNYNEIKSEGFPDSRLLNKKIKEGYRVLLFKKIGEPDYTFNSSFLANYPILSQNEDYILLGDKNICNKTLNLDRTYLESINLLYKEAFNETFSITPFELFFTKKSA